MEPPVPSAVPPDFSVEPAVPPVLSAESLDFSVEAAAAAAALDPDTVLADHPALLVDFPLSATFSDKLLVYLEEPLEPLEVHLALLVQLEPSLALTPPLPNICNLLAPELLIRLLCNKPLPLLTELPSAVSPSTSKPTLTSEAFLTLVPSLALSPLLLFALLTSTASAIATAEAHPHPVDPAVSSATCLWLAVLLAACLWSEVQAAEPEVCSGA